MKKILLILFCMILLVGNVSAFEFDNIGRYNETSRIFTIRNSVLGIPFLQLDKVAEIQLNTPDVMNIFRGRDRKVAEFTINNYENDYSNALKLMEFYDIDKGMEKFERDFTYKYKRSLGFETINDHGTVCVDTKDFGNGTILQDCSRELIGTHQEEKFEWVKLDTSKKLPTGEITIGIFTDVLPNDKVEWIPTLFGVKINEWAEWEESLEVGLKAWWNFEETSGPVVDVFGGGHNGTAYGVDRGQEGVINNAFVYNKDDDDNVTVVNHADLSSTSAFSISAWARTDLVGYNVLVVKGLDSDWFYIVATNGQNLRFMTTHTSGSDVLDSVGGLSNDTWFHVVVTFDDATDNKTIWINGTFFKSGIKAGPITGANTEIMFGGAYPPPGFSSGFNLHGALDEVAYWSRALTPVEIVNLYNNHTGINPVRSIPIVTLNSPVNAYNTTNSTIDFNCTVSDETGIMNVSLLINGTIKQTNSSGINETDYLFTEIITTGHGIYNWTCQAYNNEDYLVIATARDFTYLNNLIVTLNSPVNAYNSTSSSISFNGTASDDTAIINVSLYIDGVLNETNSSGFNATDYIFVKNLSDGDYNWTYKVCDDVLCLTATTRNFSVDATLPVINITYPPIVIDHHLLNTNLSLNWTATDTHLDSCWYNYNGTNTTVTCADNTTQINITQYSNRNVTFYANDTFGNLNSFYREWNYTVFENSQEFNNQTLEGVINTFTANVTVRESNPITVTNFIYNGTSHIASFSQSGNDFILTIDFLSPSVNVNTNLTFFWSLLFSDGQIINLTSYNQTVNIINLDDCSVNTVVLYNYTIVDEANQSQLLNTTAEFSINLLDTERQVYIFNFSKKYSNINPFAVCISENLLSSTYAVDSIVKYEAIGYAIEYYNILDATITNATIPEKITLYDLFSSDATEFKITFKAEDFTFIENALIYIDRQYIAENNSFKTVELPKTDFNGQTVGHFVRNDVLYNIRVIKDGVVLGNFKNQIAFCEDYAIGNCQIILEATPADFTIFNYDEQLGIIFQSVPTYNENTSAISFDFSTDDGTIKTVSMQVTRDDIFGNRSICNNTITSSSGTLTCSFDPNIDDSTLRVNIFVDDQPVVFSNVKLETSVYGNLGYVLWFFLTFIFILLFAYTKTEILIGLAISFTGAISLGIIKGDIIGIGSAGIWVLVIIILGIYKLNKNKPQ